MSTANILSDEFQALLLAQWPYKVNDDFVAYTRRVTELVAKRVEIDQYVDGVCDGIDYAREEDK